MLGIVATCLGLAACGGAEQAAATAQPIAPRTAHSPAALSATPSVRLTSEAPATPKAFVARIPQYPNTLRQLYVDPQNPAASDDNSGAFEAPLRTLSAAMHRLKAGDDVLVGAGTYRETVLLPALVDSGYKTVIRAAARGTVTVKGSDEFRGWEQISREVWSLAWAGNEPEQVFRAGAPLQQIGGTVFGGYPTNPANPLIGVQAPSGIWPGRISGDKSTLLPDSFTYDAADRRLYVRLSSPLTIGEPLEVSTRTYVLYGNDVTGVVIAGIDFLHSNTSLTQRHGSVYLRGSANVIRNVTVRFMDAFCVMLEGDDSRLLNSSVEYCGQAGVAANGARVSVSGNTVSHNNTRGFNKNWEAGGMKFTGSPALTDSIVSRNTAAYNNGDGIWFDWTPEQVQIKGNIAAYNAGHGIHFEASHAGTITANVTYGNEQRGIYLLESSDTKVDSNITFGNTLQGIAVLDGTRSASDPRLLPYGNSLVGNTSAWNNSHGDRIQFMLPGLSFGNASDFNWAHATDVTPRYAEGNVNTANPYRQGLPAWRPFAGQDANSQESFGPMPDTLARALADRRLLAAVDMPPLLQKAGVPKP